jgi:hypothetical protein
MRIFVLLLALSACRTDKPDDTGSPPDDTAPEAVDADGDGYPADEDCDDGDASIHPGAEESCDGIDNDCDEAVDEELLLSWFTDADGDGHGDPEAPGTGCERPDGVALTGDDCDDGDAAVNPDAAERCNGQDDDCDGEIDEDLQETWYADADGDGHGDPDSSTDSCDPGSGWVASDDDCDDSDSSVHPGAEEQCDDVDDDCDGEIDEGLESPWYQDADGDGYGDPAVEIQDCEPGAGWSEDPLDCDDANSEIHPAATERCNGLDDDCDGLTDDADTPVSGTSTWYQDLDADGYGDDASTTQACDLPSGYAALAGDCDDSDPSYNPGASETDCTDPADYNCDGSTGYADVDGDGWAACVDCDDSDAAINADGTERCNGVDDDCDGDVDEDDAVDTSTWYRDADGDTYGDLGSSVEACDQPSGHVGAAYATDCDDGDPSVHPAGAEDCDGVDDDCDGDVDEGVTSTFYADADADGYGDAGATTEACAAPSGFVTDATDCDDADGGVHPGASELCNEGDDDCDGDVDEGVTSTFYADADGDGYGSSAYSTAACSAPSGWVADDGDCDDTEPAAWPGNDERCDGIDNDCDGSVDEATAVDATTWYSDTDGDGYGDSGSATAACSAPSGSVAEAGDCDDGDAGVHPGASELCDGVDQDCDGAVDEDPVDGSTWYDDADGDGYGDPSAATAACSQPSGTVADATDCHDDEATAYPGSTATETPYDGVDQDCDGEDRCTDLNCDGQADLLIPAYRGDSDWERDSRVFYNTGYGYAASHGVALPAVGPLAAIAEDLDGDGYQDIVLGGYYDGTTRLVDSYVYWGSASGYDSADRTELATEGVIAVEARDLDLDGYTDLVFASYYGTSHASTSMIYWGSASGYDDADRTELPTYGAYDLAVADLDADGWDDLIFAQYYSGSTHVVSSYIYWGSSTGYDASDRSSLYTTGAVDVEVADLNDDGWLDLVFACYYSGSSYGAYSYVYWGSSGGPDGTAYDALYTYGAWDIEHGDLDDDGYTDLVFASYYSGSSYHSTSYVYWGNSGGYSTSDRSGLSTYGARGAVAEDFDGDGWQDLFFAQYYSGSGYSFSSYLYQGSSSGYSSKALTGLPTEGGFRAQSADLDGDGWPDLLVNNYRDASSFEIDSYVYYGSSAGFSSTNRDDLPVDGPWGHAVVVGD